VGDEARKLMHNASLVAPGRPVTALPTALLSLVLAEAGASFATATPTRRTTSGTIGACVWERVGRLTEVQLCTHPLGSAICCLLLFTLFPFSSLFSLAAALRPTALRSYLQDEVRTPLTWCE